jgi:hypothetical protein
MASASSRMWQFQYTTLRPPHIVGVGVGKEPGTGSVQGRDK